MDVVRHAAFEPVGEYVDTPDLLVVENLHSATLGRLPDLVGLRLHGKLVGLPGICLVPERHGVGHVRGQPHVLGTLAILVAGDHPPDLSGPGVPHVLRCVRHFISSSMGLPQGQEGTPT